MKTIKGDLTYSDIRESFPEEVTFEVGAGRAGNNLVKKRGKAFQAEGTACAKA